MGISLKSGVVVPGGGTMKTFPNGAVVPDSVHMQVLPGDVVVPSTGNMRTYSNGAVVPQVQSLGVPTSTHMVTHSNGAVVPAHTPAVAAAKANFQHAGGNIVSSFGVAPAVGHMVTHSNGAVVPADTPAIATAKANFAHVGGNINPKVAMAPAHSKNVYAGPMAVPGPMVTHSNGAVVPEDTPAIATAKASFHQAGGNIKPSVGVPVVPGTYAAAVVSHTNVGVVPVDTAEVKAAKAAHAAAVATAKAKFHQAGGNIDPSVTGMTGVHLGAPGVPGSYAGVVVGRANVGVVPVDTAEV